MGSLQDLILKKDRQSNSQIRTQNTKKGFDSLFNSTDMVDYKPTENISLEKIHIAEEKFKISDSDSFKSQLIQTEPSRSKEFTPPTYSESTTNKEPTTVTESITSKEPTTATESITNKEPTTITKSTPKKEAYSPVTVTRWESIVIEKIIAKFSYEALRKTSKEEIRFLCLLNELSSINKQERVRASRDLINLAGVARARITQVREKLVEKGYINTQLVIEQNREYMEYELNLK